MERPAGASSPGQRPLPQSFHSALPPPPQTLTWVWPGTTPGSAEPSLPSGGVSQRPQTGPWLMGGGCGAERESRSGWFGREARPGWGWGSAGERYQLLRMNYLPASGLRAALGCLPVHTHAATPMLQQVGERSQALTRGRRGTSACLGCSHRKALVKAQNHWLSLLGPRNIREGELSDPASGDHGNKEAWDVGHCGQFASGFRLQFAPL